MPKMPRPREWFYPIEEEQPKPVNEVVIPMRLKCTHERCNKTRIENRLTCLECPERFIEFTCQMCGSKNPTIKMEIRLPRINNG